MIKLRVTKARMVSVISLLVPMLTLATCSRKKTDDDTEKNPLLVTEDDEKPSDHLLNFRSVNEVNQLLRTRVVQEQDFDILNQLIRFDDTLLNVLIGTSTKKDVATLMGAYQGLGLRVATDSLKPSTVHAMIWGLTLQDFAAEIGKSCTEKSSYFTLNAPTASVVDRLCTSNVGITDSDIKALWDILIRKDANEHEFEVWLSEERGPLLSKRGGDLVTSIVYAMLYGPEFLIGR